MIQKINNEIESFLENVINCENNSINRYRIKSNIEYVLDTHIHRNDIVDYNVICDEENNSVYQNHINIDVYIVQYKHHNKFHLNFIYTGNKIEALQRLRRKKLNKLNEAR